ncbi:MAG: hypothetical protein JWN46_2850 [Acidimicrobiales bacterium]|nr:hypothetical protein [Acidimicrobiales bacterium]
MSDDRIQWLVDRAEITETVYGYAAGMDTRDWELYRSVFMPEVQLDFSSYSGQPASVQTADELVEGAKFLISGLDASQHSMSNPRISIDGDTAECIVYAVADHILVNELGESSYRFGGYYTDGLVRTSAGWKIASVRLTVSWHRGNKHVLRLAYDRVKAARAASATAEATRSLS